LTAVSRVSTAIFEIQGTYVSVAGFGYFTTATRAARVHLQETRLGGLMMVAGGLECTESIDISGT
jgi:hypothetical protein